MAPLSARSHIHKHLLVNPQRRTLKFSPLSNAFKYPCTKRLDPPFYFLFCHHLVVLSQPSICPDANLSTFALCCTHFDFRNFHTRNDLLDLFLLLVFRPFLLSFDTEALNSSDPSPKHTAIPCKARTIDPRAQRIKVPTNRRCHHSTSCTGG